MNGQNPTAGPWHWIRRDDGIHLGTLDRGMLVVMDFARLGTQGAQPRFATWVGAERERHGGLMKKAMEFESVEESPDARLIAAAPELLAALKSVAYWMSDAVIPCCFPRQTILDAIDKAEGRTSEIPKDMTGY